MIFARCWDLFWLIEPNFPDARRNLHFSFGILEYCAVPVALFAFWLAYYFTQFDQAAAGPGKRSAPGGDSGARTCPRITRRNVPKNDTHSHGSPDMAASVREGYEVTDVSVQGILVFLVGLFVSVGVFFVFCFGMGKVINDSLAKHDGPPNKWHSSGTETAGKLKNMESNPAGVQQELHQLTQSFPTPRLQLDDGNQDVASLHQREDLLLGHYSWVDRGQGQVRIPIERAMELIAQRGLPVATAPAGAEPLMAGDSQPMVQMPLTSGFARTGYEQEQASPTREPGEQASTKANNN